MSALKESAAESIGRGIELGELPRLLSFNLHLAHLAMYRDFTDALAELDLTQKQCGTLILIELNPGISQIEIGGALSTDRSTMMATVDRLEERGLIRRKRSLMDGRRHELTLTSAGAHMLSRVKPLIAAHEARFTERFSQTELGVLQEYLGRVHRGL